MRYTVKELATLSKISVRTLHWYDAMGLLKPSSKGPKNYRYYQEKEWLRLQQILFFKELGFSLNNIQKLLMESNDTIIKMLELHKKNLKSEVVRKKKLIQTIDKTLHHLQGRSTMNPEELCYGFEDPRQKTYEAYISKKYKALDSQNLIQQSHNRTAKWDKDKWDTVKQNVDFIHKALVHMITAEKKPWAPEVQDIIHQHFQMIQQFYKPSKDVYGRLADLYAQHNDFKRFFESYHPKMVDYLREAMRYYAEQSL